MISTFDLEKLHSLLEDFYSLTKIRTVIFNENFRELDACPREPAQFCQVMRACPEGLAECRECDEKACAHAASRHETYTYRCYAGLTESITPLFQGNLVIGYLLFGHVFSYPSHEEGWEEIKKLSEDFDVDHEALKSACFKMPIIQEDYISSAAHILRAVGSYLCMERMASLHTEDLPVRIDTYLGEHYTEDLTSEDLCRIFSVSRTRLYQIFRQSYGCGVAEHIRELRMDRAKELLDTRPDMTIAEVAADCGYQDYNYFITVFRHETGISPRRYRVREKGRTEIPGKDGTQI